MAKVVLNPMVRTLHGKLGDVVFRSTPNGKVSLIKRADMSKVKWSNAQQTKRNQFKEAIAYAKAAMADSTISVIYKKKAKKQNKRAFHLAVSDYMKGKNLLAAEKK